MDTQRKAPAGRRNMAHTFAPNLVHVVFSTKQRRPVLQSSFRDRLFAYMGGILRDLGAKPLIINGTADHAHMLFSLPSTKRSHG